MSESPEQVLARAARDAEALRRRGFGAEADRDEQLIADFREALRPIRLVSEATAMVRSGKSARWLRSHHASWCLVGAAGWSESGARLYRLCILPTALGASQGAADAEVVLAAMEEAA